MAAGINTPKLLIVDDEEAIRLSVRKIFQKEGFEVTEAADGEEAIQAITGQPPDVVLTDMSMPNMGGMELISAIHQNAPDIQLIMMTAYGDMDSVKEAMRNGAYDFINKPFKRDQIIQAVNKALEHRLLLVENRLLKEKIANSGNGSDIIVSSPAMNRVISMLKQAATTDVTILLTGESGTGKEVMARMIHRNSTIADQPFVPINCGALPESILESELFGHEKGSFTGADKLHIGLFERADGGTLFLDEIGEMSPALQVKLLRVLQDGTFTRVGGQKTIHVTTRIIAATNADLEKAVAAGTFREDLYYRLNVVAAKLPPLRERTEDIAPLAQHFVTIFAKQHQHQISGLTPWALSALEKYPWPGNVRELQNVIERAVVLGRGEQLTVDDLPPNFHAENEVSSGNGYLASADEIRLPRGLTMEQIQDIVMEDTMRQFAGDKNKAARQLGINVRTIYRWLDEKAKGSHGE